MKTEVETTEHDIGTFMIKSDLMVVSDPCYARGTWCAGEIKAKSGLWHAKVFKGVMDDWGNRVLKLKAVHGSVPMDTQPTEQCDFEVGVDSGQAGLFDPAHYNSESEAWYDNISHLTLHTEVSAGTTDYGCVSSSGFGDGGYRCYVLTDPETGEATCVEIEFINVEDYYKDE